MPGRRLAVVLALLALPVAAAACGGSKSSSSSSSVSPMDAVTGAAEKTAAAGSEHLALKATGSFAGQKLTLGGSGDFDTKRNAGTLHLDLSAGPVATTIDEVLSGGVAYVKSPLFSIGLPAGKTWLKLDLAKAAASQGVDLSSLLSQDPSQALTALKSLRGATKVGTETIDGASTTHYRARIDASKLGAAAGSATARIPGSYDVWIGDDGYVHRVRTRLAAATGGQNGAVALTVDLSDFGKKVAVTIPPVAQTADTNGSIPGLGG